MDVVALIMLGIFSAIAAGAHVAIRRKGLR